MPRYFDVAPLDPDPARVLADCYWQPEPKDAATLVGLHGLEGSSSAHYMRGLADKAWRSGFNVVLLNQRNCGGTEHLSAGLYHSGLTSDPRQVIDELIGLDRLASIVVAGYSLGGNLALKLAGDYGEAAPPQPRSMARPHPDSPPCRCRHWEARLASASCCTSTPGISVRTPCMGWSA